MISGPIVIRIPIRLNNPVNGPQGMSKGLMIARANERKSQRRMAHAIVKAHVGEMSVLPAVVTMTRIAPRKIDAHDNLPAAFKSFVDGTADALGIKDNDPRITWKYDQRREGVRQYGVEIRIESGGEK